METASQSARDILTGLHEIMASKGNAQAKLNKVVEVIGGSLVSEVCSIYLLRDGSLELFATRGLNEAAVHVTRLGLGAGVIGGLFAEVSEDAAIATVRRHRGASAHRRGSRALGLRF